MTTSGFSVLLVDDTKMVADAFARLLQALGHRVQVAYSGQDALELFRAGKPDVVISDLTMPGMDGYELARALRQEPSGQQAVIVVLSGYGQDQEQEKARGAGFDYHLTKPASAADLRQLFSAISENRRATG